DHPSQIGRLAIDGYLSFRQRRSRFSGTAGNDRHGERQGKSRHEATQAAHSDSLLKLLYQSAGSGWPSSGVMAYSQVVAETLPATPRTLPSIIATWQTPACELLGRVGSQAV